MKPTDIPRQFFDHRPPSMIDPEQLAYRNRSKARQVYQRLLDYFLEGDPVAYAALQVRYRPILQFLKEGPDVGQREAAESKNGRIN